MSSKLEKSRLPQSSYFAASHSIPGTQWTIAGHSRALERTGFYVPQLRVMFDAGVDLPTDSGARPLAIFVTHGHIDHMNALPMLLRHREECDPPTQIFAPWQVVHRLREIVQLTWAVKVDIDEEEPLPDAYAPPAEEDRLPAPGTVLEGDLPYRSWMPCDAETRTVIRVGKKGATPIGVQSLRLFHGRCSSVGYLISDPVRTVKKLRPDLLGEDKRSTGENVKAAKRRGEDIHVEIEEPEAPRFAFVLDTTIDALDEEKSSTARRILDCPAVMIECTYLEDDMREEGRRRGHVTWCDLVPYVIESARRRRRDGGMTQTWYLVHFSLRYTDKQIVDFFSDEAMCNVNFKRICNAGGDEATPPDVVLWVDTGPFELWVDPAWLSKS